MVQCRLHKIVDGYVRPNNCFPCLIVLPRDSSKNEGIFARKADLNFLKYPNQLRTGNLGPQ